MRNALSFELGFSCSSGGAFSYCMQDFFVFCFQKFDCVVSGCGFLFFDPVLDLLSYLNLQLSVFCQYWEVFSHYFLNCFLSTALFLFSFWYSNDMNVRSFVIISQISEALFIFSVYFLSVLYIGQFLLFCLLVHWFFSIHSLHSAAKHIH